ncbi:uncharacterized protein LMH87_007640 [Akanthomyces muscarius]|uniref:Uncharacterized protein n=1 Tax=Akanthomyces muscarius TaxID=2231603 RepID=A0A9W8QK58_AKAMU|nr:uncharacterized protein LMH87_007640 [Akanthomyces muscarius]KAJ4161610.1 hypothetical protein LMH87_007640 [Akanthomyces muscarius]
MAQLEKTLFRWPNVNIFPPDPDGPLGLGSILTKVSEPRFPLNRGNIHPLCSYPVRVKKNFLVKDKQDNNGVVRLWLRVLDILGIGASTTLGRIQSQEQTFVLETLEIRSFDPSVQYLKEALTASPEIQTYIAEKRHIALFRTPVTFFIVTDIVLAKAGGCFAHVAQARTEAAVSGGLSFDLDFDPGSRVKVGADVDITQCAGHEVRLDLDPGAIIAYGVQKVVFGRRITIKPYGKDAFMSRDGDQDDRDVLCDEQDSSVSLDELSEADMDDAKELMIQHAFNF